MSRNSSEEWQRRKVQLAKALAYYLEGVGWQDLKMDFRPVSIVVNMRRVIHLSEAECGPVEFCLGFSIRLNDEGIGALESFVITATILPGHSSTRAASFSLFLEPIAFLRHWSKRFITEYDSDESYRSDEVWTIRSARSLQALLDAYDDLAARIGSLTLFQPLGKAS